MELIGSGDNNRIDVFPLQHFFQAGKRVFDFKFRGDAAGMICGDVGHGDEASLWYEAANVLGVPPPHRADS